MKGAIPSEAIHEIKGYIHAKLETFASANNIPVEILSQRVAELLHPMGSERMQDRVQNVRSYTPRRNKKQRGTVEMGRPAQNSGTSHLQPESDQSNQEGKTGKTRKKWTMSAEAKKRISEARKQYWANLTPEAKTKLVRKTTKAAIAAKKAKAAA